MGLIENIKNALNGRIMTVSGALPPYPQQTPLISRDWLVQNDGRRDFIIIHHSATYDNPQTFDWRAIDRYHRSFRINWDIAAPPVDGPADDENGRLVRYMDNWYEREKVNQFYEELGEQAGEEVAFGTSVTETVKGDYYETPWRKIGYNLGIERAGDSASLEYGRSLLEHGAHCNQMGMNSLSIGICIIGNYDSAPPDGEIWRLAIRACREIIAAFPKILILGHHEVQGVLKSCPGKQFSMDRFRNDVLDGKFS